MKLNNQESKVYKSFDLEQLGLLPRDWQKQVEDTVLNLAKLVHLDGKSSTSREPDDTEGCDCYILTGDIIQKELNWLYRLYTNELVELATAEAKTPMNYSNDVESSIVINSLRGVDARYEWHVDSNPLTGILYATTHKKGEGGELVFKTNSNLIKVIPTAGKFILFDARDIPHCVFPLTVNLRRSSIPMNFYFQDQELIEDRPDDLNNYLFGRK